MREKKDITAIILAGGKSSRMKEDKGLAIFNGKRLVEHVIDKVKNSVSEILIITSNPVYQQLGYQCVEDKMKDKGPLGGIYTGLLHSSRKKNLLLGCDMPFVSENLINHLIMNCGEEDVLFTEHRGKAEPLFSVYDKTCIPIILSSLKSGKLKITEALHELHTKKICFDKENWFSGNEFANINSLEEWKKYSMDKNQ
jgi:molybdopterin-guanine dinucleotide biosynthesis protein A